MIILTPRTLLNSLVIIGLLVALPLWSGFLLKKFAVAGRYEHSHEGFTGYIEHNIYTGNAKIFVESQIGNIQCQGHSYTGDTEEITVSAKRAGIFEMTCTDGRQITGEWVAPSLSKGWGRGKDNAGYAFRFNFAHTLAKAKEDLEQHK